MPLGDPPGRQASASSVNPPSWQSQRTLLCLSGAHSAFAHPQAHCWLSHGPSPKLLSPQGSCPGRGAGGAEDPTLASLGLGAPAGRCPQAAPAVPARGSLLTRPLLAQAQSPFSAADAPLSETLQLSKSAAKSPVATPMSLPATGPAGPCWRCRTGSGSATPSPARGEGSACRAEVRVLFRAPRLPTATWQPSGASLVAGTVSIQDNDEGRPWSVWPRTEAQPVPRPVGRGRTVAGLVGLVSLF